MRGKACACGRPLRLDKVGLVQKGIYSCGREACKKKLEPKEPEPIGKPSFDADDEAWLSYMGGV
jgi:hypothetical protein